MPALPIEPPAPRIIIPQTASVRSRLNPDNDRILSISEFHAAVDREMNSAIQFYSTNYARIEIRDTRIIEHMGGAFIDITFRVWPHVRN